MTTKTGSKDAALKGGATKTGGAAFGRVLMLITARHLGCACGKKDSRRRSKLGYSILSARMGEMEAARLAGIMAAKKEQTARAAAATDRASGSQEETP